MKEEEKKKKTTKKVDAKKKETVKKAAKKTVSKKEEKVVEKKENVKKTAAKKKETVKKDTKKTTAKKETPKKESTKTKTAVKVTKVEKKEPKKKTIKKSSAKKTVAIDREEAVEIFGEEKVKKAEEKASKKVNAKVRKSTKKKEEENKFIVDLDVNVDQNTLENEEPEEVVVDEAWNSAKNEKDDNKFINAGDIATKMIYGDRYTQQKPIDQAGLVAEVAEKLHNNWCEEEIKDFYGRVVDFAKNNEYIDIIRMLNRACFRTGKRNNNEYVINEEMLDKNDFIESLNNYDTFRNFVGTDDSYPICLKKYVEQIIPENERQSDYKNASKMENILRPFKELSTEAKKKNIAASIDAFNAYKELTEAYVSIDDMENDNDTRILVTKAMNVSQMKNDPSYRVKYADLPEAEKENDLYAFDILIDTVKNNREYFLYPLVDVDIPDYDTIEENIINGVGEVIPVANIRTLDENRVLTSYELEQKLRENGELKDEDNYQKRIMGYAGIWTVAISTAVLTAGIFILGAFYLG